jgi:NTP pyrophosphatase (non-canonical NTP hydrolase)
MDKNSWHYAQMLVTKFRDEREWKQFHSPKELAAQLAIEAGELQEVFLWKQSNEADRNAVARELADVFFSALLIADEYNFDINQIIKTKLEETARKYPIEKARGTNKKYTEL